MAAREYGKKFSREEKRREEKGEVVEVASAEFHRISAAIGNSLYNVIYRVAQKRKRTSDENWFRSLSHRL